MADDEREHGYLMVIRVLLTHCEPSRGRTQVFINLQVCDLRNP